MGLRLPERKGIADFLQEVTSPKDQHKYRAAGTADRYIDVPTFAAAFADTAAARQTADRLAMPFDKAASLPGTLVSCRRSASACAVNNDASHGTNARTSLQFGYCLQH